MGLGQPLLRTLMDLRLTPIRSAFVLLSPRARGAIFVGLFTAVAACSGISAEAQTAPPVETEVVREAPIVRKLELSGTVTSPHESQISTSVEGLVSKVYFDSGARVKTGDLLLELRQGDGTPLVEQLIRVVE